MPSHWSLKSYNSEHSFATVHVTRRADTYLSVALHEIRTKETRVFAELTVQIIKLHTMQLFSSISLPLHSCYRAS
jgi:hypothetical protein